MLVRFVPIRLTAVMITTAIPAAIKAYSIAVAPWAFAIKFFTLFIIDILAFSISYIMLEIVWQPVKGVERAV